MSVFLASLQIGAFLAIALACLVPRLRQKVAVFLLALGIAALVHATLAAGDAPRSLKITTTFQAYEGLNLVRKAFEVDQAQAPAWSWALLCGLFALAWAGWAWRCRHGRLASPYGAPLALAWSGCALGLALEKAAAPHGLVAPFDLLPHRVLIPATLAAALCLARTLPKVWLLPLYLSLFLGVTQVALGLFATAATINGWGTHLDVHTIDFIAVGRQPLEFAPGSAKQCWWLIGVPHLVVFPAIYMMSLGGIAFGVMMAGKQRQVDHQASATVGDA